MTDTLSNQISQDSEDDFIFDDSVVQDDSMTRQALIQGRDPEDPTRFLRIRVFNDPDPSSLDDMCSMEEDSSSMGILLYAHSRYTFPGVKLNGKSAMEYFEENDIDPDKDLIILPVYMYDHSGLTVSTSPFNDPFDSGQLGIIYTTEERAKAFLSSPHQGAENPASFIKGRKEQIEEILTREIEIFDDYLRGNVYGFICEEAPSPEGPWEEVDSCWGFLGNIEQTGMVDHICASDSSAAALWEKAFPTPTLSSVSEKEKETEANPEEQPKATSRRAPGL